MKSVLLSIILCLSSFSVCGQYIIKGKVIGTDDKLPLPHVTILVEDTDRNYKSDLNGEFAVSASFGQTLIFRYPGYITRHVLIRDSSYLETELKPDVIQDDFGLDRIHFYFGREVINGMLGGKLKYLSGPIGRVVIEPSISHYSNKGLSLTEAELKLHRLIYSYPNLSIGTSIGYQQLDFGDLDKFESITLSFQPKLRYFRGNIGVGLNQIGQDTGKTLGFLLGLRKELKIAEFHYLPIETKIIFWDRNFQFGIFLQQQFYKRFELQIGYQYFNGINLLQVSIGNSIRLWRRVDNDYKD